MEDIRLNEWIKKVTALFPTLKEIYLWGSRLEGTHNKDSDYDLVFVFEDEDEFTLIAKDGFRDFDYEKVYDVLNKHNLRPRLKNGSYLFHITYRGGFERTTHWELGNPTDISKLIWSREPINRTLQQ